MSSILEGFHELVPTEVLSIVAHRVEEPEFAVADGFRGSIQAIACAIAERSVDAGFMKDLTAVAGRFSEIPDPLTAIGRVVPPLPGVDTTTPTGSWLSRLYGASLPDLVENVATYAGIRRASAASILCAGAALVLAHLGRQLRTGHLTPALLGDELRAQREQLVSTVPSGLQVPRIRSESTGDRRTAPTTASYIFHQPLASSWSAPLVVGLMAFGVGGLFGVGSLMQSVSSAAGVQARVTTTETLRGVAAAGALGPIDPNRPVGTSGRDPDFYTTATAASAEDRLSAFLATTNLGTTTIPIDRVSFDRRSSTLNSEAQEQIDQLAAILRNHRDARLVVNGYASEMHEPGTNLVLSWARAQAVADRLKAGGVDGKRITTKGRGTQRPPSAGNSETPSSIAIEVSVP